jgi:hypothetical protein
LKSCRVQTELGFDLTAFDHQLAAKPLNQLTADRLFD